MIHIVLASDNNYFPGLFVTISSLLNSNKTTEFHLHIIDGGLVKKNKTKIKTHLVSNHAKSIISFYDFDLKIFRQFKPLYGKSLVTYARIFIPSIINVNKIIYFDSDLLILDKISPLWNIDLKDNLVAAVQDPIVKNLKNDYPYSDSIGDEKYFNAGVMLINLDAMRKMEFSKKLFELVSRDSRKFRFHDQTALNILFKGKVLYLDTKWNSYADSHTINSRSIVIHYLTKFKPWNSYNNTESFRLWRNFANRYSIHVNRLIFQGGLTNSGKYIYSYLRTLIKSFIYKD